MQIVSQSIEPIDETHFRMVTVFDIRPAPTIELASIGEGPTRSTVPDRIVKYLLREYSQRNGNRAVKLAWIRDELGGNPATVNRQATTLANNAPDVPERLRGWVSRVGGPFGKGSGAYQLSHTVRRAIDEGDIDPRAFLA